MKFKGIFINCRFPADPELKFENQGRKHSNRSWLRPRVNISCPVFYKIRNSLSWENDHWNHGNLKLKSVKFEPGTHERRESKIEPEIEGMDLSETGWSDVFNMHSMAMEEIFKEERRKWNSFVARAAVERKRNQQCRWLLTHCVMNIMFGYLRYLIFILYKILQV